MRVHRRAFLVRQGSAAAGAAFVAVFAVGCNHPPLVNAGDDMTVYAGSTVTLDGSHSVDVDHDAPTFKWVQTLGEPVAVTTNADGTGTFVAPSFRTELAFDLTVSDGKAEQTDSVNIHVVVDHGPQVNAGLDQTVAKRAHVNLYGSATDPFDSAGAYTCRELEIADLTGDGTFDVVCLGKASTYDATARIVVLSAATLQLEWQTAALPLGYTEAVGNVDGDAALEIVTSGGYVLDGATQSEEWVYATGFGSPVDTGDMDGDGVEEIAGVATTGVRGYSAVAQSPLWESRR